MKTLAIRCSYLKKSRKLNTQQHNLKRKFFKCIFSKGLSFSCNNKIDIFLTSHIPHKK